MQKYRTEENIYCLLLKKFFRVDIFSIYKLRAELQ